MKEELKQKMIGVIGTHSNALIESIAEKCAQVAIDHYKERESALSMSGVVESAELVACDEQGTPIIGEHGEKICNCAEPWQSLFPDNKYYCLHCWGEWYH